MKWALALTAAGLLAGCSDNTSTAGVISETESGKTIAGIVTDFDGNTIKGAKVALMRSDFIAVRGNPEMETTTDDSGKFSFEDIKSDTFNIQVSSDGLLDFRNILDITKPEDSVYRFEVSEGSNLKLELNAYDL
ncbi:MAG: carboxypeptidase regulatory-like domain-containing protein, partial [Fibrobacter sp.]|nr:carboxypeptidase regulatory-like domain-containing protein [Fibrobacter sp.]